MVALNKKTVVSYCFLISKISLPVHNFGIKMLLIITKIKVVNPNKAGEGHNVLLPAVFGCNSRPSISIV